MEKCGIAISDKGHRIVGKYSSEVGIVEILDDFVRNQKVKVYTVKQCFCCWLLIFRTRFNRFKKTKGDHSYEKMSFSSFKRNQKNENQN